MSTDKYNVIIVGGGLSGLATAYSLAQAGVEVVVVERGDYCGAKNLSGGVFYSRIMDKLIPGFAAEAPIERCITNYITTLMTKEDYLSIEYKGQALKTRPYNAVSVLRARFDRWLAEKAEEAGAMIVTGIKVDHVLKDGQKVVGIRAGEEEMLADVVVAADGINSFVARKAELRGAIYPEHLAVGVKAVIGLSREAIEERFRLSGNEGTAYAILGEATYGVAGGAFCYTNLDSISVGVVMRLDDLVKKGRKPSDALDNLLEHAMISPLVKDGKMLEYGAHLTGEGGLNMVPAKLSGDGWLVVGDAAGFTINSGFVIRGMDLAIESGMAAARAIIEARKQDDYSGKALTIYDHYLQDSFIMKDLKLYARTPAFMENDRLYNQYAAFANQCLQKVYMHDLTPREHLLKIALAALQENGISLFGLAKDGMKGVRAL